MAINRLQYSPAIWVSMECNQSLDSHVDRAKIVQGVYDGTDIHGFAILKVVQWLVCAKV